MRGRSMVPVAVLLVLSALLGACKMGKMDIQPKVDFTGTTLTVWDLSQPVVPGVPDYKAETLKIVSDFASLHGVQVDLRFAGRKEACDVLLGRSEAEKPDLVCTGEWPFIPEGACALAGLAPSGPYIDLAAAYWQKDGALMGIPAYVHWVGTASRGSGSGTAYSWNSPAFLTAAMGSHRACKDAEAVASYLRWVLSEWGEADSAPFLSWEEGSAGALYPLTPFLWQRLRDEEQTVTLKPVLRQSGDSFFYTVPAYVVLAEDPPARQCAMELGTLLAGHLGRWAARALSCVPALREDISVFNLESRLGYEDRSALIDSLSSQALTAPTAAEYLEWEASEASLRQIAGEYLGGEATEEEALRGIHEALERHTRP